MGYAFRYGTRRRLPYVLVGALLLGSAGRGADAQNRFWSPLATSTDWMTAANWDPPDSIPQSHENALITFNGTYDVALAENQSIRGLTLGGTGGVQTLRLTSGAVLTLAEEGSIQGVGLLVLDDGNLTGPLENHATIRMHGGTLSALQVNRGLVEALDSANTIETSFPSFNGQYGTLRIAGSASDAAVTYGTVPNNLPLLSAGRIELVSTNGWEAMLEMPGGWLENLATGVISLSGNMDDVRLYTTHVENHGLISGQGSLDGSYRQSSTGLLQLDIAGTTAGQQYEVLNVATSADLDGGLIVDFQSGFQPADTDEFHVLRRSSGSGEFDTVQVSGIPGYAFSVAYQADGVILNFRRGGVLPGDYNDNGLVEQADLDQVLTNWGSEGRTPVGWTNDLPDGLIDQNELDRVLSNWGRMQPDLEVASAGVPEPATWVLLLLTILAVRWSPFFTRSLAGGRRGTHT